MKDAADYALRSGRPAEATALLALASRSKQVWGYDAEYMEDWLSEWAGWLPDFARFDVVVAVRDRSPAGFYALDDLGNRDAELWALFVDPSVLRQGLGRRLMRDAVDRAKQHGFKTLIIHADPNAAAFYEGWQVSLVEETACSRQQGRMLPTFRLDLDDNR